MRILLVEYKNTLQDVKEEIVQIDKLIEPIVKKEVDHKMTPEDEAQLQELRRIKSALNSDKANLEYAINWMRTGRQPYSYNGIENRKAYEHKSYPPSFFNQIEAPVQGSIDEPIKGVAVEYLLKDLTEKEKDVFILISLGHSMREVADMTRMNREKVRRLYIQADIKVKKRSNLV
ncbi:hypothetical protein [Rossellomorea marisflavi]|uniref:hypothetical protein n=1 Tax=Rossellomorea marisflavi TaxID=189381 RepID=UPI003D2F4F1B